MEKPPTQLQQLTLITEVAAYLSILKGIWPKAHRAILSQPEVQLAIDQARQTEKAKAQ